MYSVRHMDYQELESLLNTKILVYVTGDRPGWETQIHQEVLDHFVDHLDLIGRAKKISLILYTRGGSTLGGWSIVNLIRQFCDEFEIIVPSKAHSAGTLMCLGANSIIMTKQATLGPIDPSVNTPLNPEIPGSNPMANAKYPVSVEAIKGFFELAKTELNINNEEDLTEVLIKLADKVHPLVLGEVYRAKSQIKMLAEKLLAHQNLDRNQIENIINFLVSDSGSHDYTIYRKEAMEYLGLNVIKPTEEIYKVIKRIYNDILDDLKLTEPFDPESILGTMTSANYGNVRGLIESVNGGSHYFMSEGELQRFQNPGAFPNGMIPPGLNPINDIRKFEGWRFENVPVRISQ